MAEARDRWSGTARFRTISDVKTERPGMNRAFSRLAISAADSSNEPARYAGLQSASAVWHCSHALSLGMVALAVMVGGGTMCLGSAFVMFGSLIVFISSHGILFGCESPSRHKLTVSESVPTTGQPETK
jgi:hypothetical protein